jgi:protein gp37
MGDLFAKIIPAQWIAKIVKIIRRFPQTQFLFLTKNPSRYVGLEEYFPFNVTLGATIETNRSMLAFSKAPDTHDRFDAMSTVQSRQTFIAIEPICDFDVNDFASWIYTIQPWAVAVGYDNYENHLPEPSLDKTFQLIARLEKFTRVIRKTLREGI